MPRVIILQHDDGSPPGWLGDALASRGVESSVVRVHEGEWLDVPGAEVAALVSLGGRMGAYEEREYPFLIREKRLLRHAVGRGTLVLGLCLGCQILVEALGGRVTRAPRFEAGYVPIEVTPEGREDPVVGLLTDPILSFHGDTWEVPPGARLLARSELYPQAFRLGSGLGLQFHAEISPSILERWLEGFGGALTRQGYDVDRLAEDGRRNEPAARAVAERLFGAWIDEVERRCRPDDPLARQAARTRG